MYSQPHLIFNYGTGCDLQNQLAHIVYTANGLFTIIILFLCDLSFFLYCRVTYYAEFLPRRARGVCLVILEVRSHRCKVQLKSWEWVVYVALCVNKIFWADVTLVEHVHMYDVHVHVKWISIWLYLCRFGGPLGVCLEPYLPMEWCVLVALAGTGT